MKQFTRLLFVAAFLAIGISANAQMSKPVERIYALPYDSVWKAVKSTILDNKYNIVVDKKKDGIIETDELMVVEYDSIIDVMNQFGEVPFIASADWKWGQSQLKAIVRMVDTVVHLKLTAQLRAFDRHVTNKWAFFESNGKIENALFDEVERRLGR